MGNRFRVPEEPKIVVSMVELVTEQAKLRITVDPTQEDVGRFTAPKVPFRDLQKLREVYGSALEYARGNGEASAKVFVQALREALEFAESQEPVVEEDDDE